MAQKANLTPVDKYESDRWEAERLDLEKHARLEAGLIDPMSATQPAPASGRGEVRAPVHARRVFLKLRINPKRTARPKPRDSRTRPRRHRRRAP
jgi:hypothetical protein